MARPRGQKPLPSNVKRIRGTDQPCRMNTNEPVLETENTLPARELGKIAQKCWDRHLPILQNARVLTDGDVLALTLLCENWQTWDEAHTMVRSKGPVVQRMDKDGNMIGWATSPFWMIERDSQKQILGLLTELGLTPSSRTRVSTTATSQKTNSFSQFA